LSKIIEYDNQNFIVFNNHGFKKYNKFNIILTFYIYFVKYLHCCHKIFEKVSSHKNFFEVLFSI